MDLGVEGVRGNVLRHICEIRDDRRLETLQLCVGVQNLGFRGSTLRVLTPDS
jgi:hypothetical protein